MQGTERERKERLEAQINFLFAIYTQSSLQFQNNGAILTMKNKTAVSDTFYGSDFRYYTTREAKTVLNA